jgi:hypothetical protein
MRRGRIIERDPAQIHGPNFTAGIILWDDKVIEAAPIIHDMKRGQMGTRSRAEYCRQRPAHRRTKARLTRDV